MATGRYVILGLAHPRSAWFRAVSQWANSAALPAEFVKVLSPEELRARLSSGRPYSVVLVDASLPAVDRDLISTANDAGCPVLVVDDLRVDRDWRALGVSATLAPDFDRAALLDALSTNARLISRVEAGPIDPLPLSPVSPWRGTVVTVVGSGGTGVSTVAIAVAQGLADDVRFGGSIVLADFCRHAEQAMLHDTREVAPGIQELVEAHRAGRPSADEVRSLAFAVPRRRYDLLLGLRRARFWSTMRPAAFAAAFGSLTHAYQGIVVDCDGDLEGEDAGGSLDVEERNMATRTAVDEANVVMAVGSMSMKGLHSLTRLLADLNEHGVPVERVVPVFNLAHRSPRQRATYSAALADLTRWRAELAAAKGATASPPVFVPVRAIDAALRDGARLPDLLVRPLAAGASLVLRPRDGASDTRRKSPFMRVVPGTLGSWSTEHDDLDDEQGAVG